MIKILIADNSQENHNNFKSLIKSHPQFAVVDCIDDSTDIFGALNETEAELLVGDIRVICGNNYSIIKKLNQYFPKVKCVFYGIYEDKSYLEKSMDDGCIYHMFKPVRPKELTKALQEASRLLEIEAEKEKAHKKLEQSYKNSMAIFEDRFFINLVHGNIDSEREIEQGIFYFNLPLKPEYTVFVVEVDDYRIVSLALDEDEKHVLIYSIQAIVKEKLGDTGIAFITHFNNVAGIVGGDVTYEKIYSICHAIRDDVKIDNNFTVTIGIGRSCAKATEIAISYRQAKSALRYANRVGHDTIIPIDFVEPKNQITYDYPLKKEQLLVYTTVIGNKDGMLKNLNAIFASLKKCDVDMKLLGKILLDITVSLNRYATEQKTVPESEFVNLIPLKEILNLKTIDEAYAFMKDKLEQFCILVHKNTKEKEDEIYTSAKAYAQQNYSDRFNIMKISYNLNCTGAYLNQIFLERENMTYSEYFTRIRMDFSNDLHDISNKFR